MKRAGSSSPPLPCSLNTNSSTDSQTVSLQRFEPYAFIAQGDAVVTLLHVEGTVLATGRTYSTEDAQVATYRDGKLVRFCVYSDTAATAAAFAGNGG